MEDLLQEVTYIKYLLILFILICLFYTVIFIQVISRLANGNGIIAQHIQNKKRENQVKTYLAKNEVVLALKYAQQWVADYPNEPIALWYLAKAYDLKGEYVDTKKTLTKLQNLSPSWSTSIKPWLESLEDSLVPKAVVSDGNNVIDTDFKL